jgi:hypothetical protein
MVKTIIKIILIYLTSTSLYATNIEYGHGTLDITAGYDGNDVTLSSDISTYSLVEHHKNLFASSYYYKYNFTWYTSEALSKAQNAIDLSATPMGALQDTKLKGLDINMVLGKDLYHKDENNFIAIGLMIGLSVPLFDTADNNSSSNDNNSSSNNNSLDAKTKLLTYKIGPSISVNWNQNKYIMFYGSATYAYQMANIKNDYLSIDSTVNGTFQKYDFGIKIQPFARNYQTKYLTISPRLYATFGYRYTRWDLDSIDVNIASINQSFNKVDFSSKASVAYFGIGYDFF